MTAAIRVCHVMSADLWAGAEVQVATVASHLVRRPDVTVTAALFNDGPLAAELQRLGVPVTVIDEHTHRAPHIVEELARLMRARGVDIVHTHRYKDTLLGAMAARLAGVPFLIRTVHGRPEPMQGVAALRFRAYHAMDRAVLRWCADGMVAVSSSVAEMIAPLGGRYAPVVRLPNGIDLGRVRAVRPRQAVREALGVDADAPLVGVVGRLSAVKGHTYFLEAAQAILVREPRARFIVVGDGELRERLEAAAWRRGLRGHCMFVGARTDVYDLVAAMDVFVLPSLDEGTPMALLEAMALRRPIVASAVGGVPDIVADGASGLLVPPADPDALATACLGLIGDPALASRLGAEARAAVASGFSHDTNGERLVYLYRSLMTRGPVPMRRRLQARLRAAAGTARVRGWVRRAALSIQRRASLAIARSAERLRRDPARTRAALHQARSVLILCQGNIIRSPFAARLLVEALGPSSNVTIASAGLGAVAGRRSPPAPVTAAEAFHIDLRCHEAAPVTADAVDAADVIFVMDVPQLAAMRDRFPAAVDKTFLLASLAVDEPIEIRDPIMGGEAACRFCFEHIARATRPLVAALRRA